MQEVQEGMMMHFSVLGLFFRKYIFLDAHKALIGCVRGNETSISLRVGI